MQRANGQYFTTHNPFEHEAFLKWAEECCLKKQRILEPFAGGNHLITHLEDLKLMKLSDSFDLEPAHNVVKQRNTIKDFPKGYSVCITNPPWLAKNSATLRGLDFPETSYNDLYKVCLNLCLENCDWVAVLIPESFIRSGQFTERLVSFVSITKPLFKDTENPVGLALFQPDCVKQTDVWVGEEKVGILSDLMAYRYETKLDIPVLFNKKNGNIGLKALDNTQGKSIKFCNVKEIGDYTVVPTGRSITKIKVKLEDFIKESLESFLKKLNDILNEIREKTKDIILTSYKGLRKDHMYRRRLDWELARSIIYRGITQYAS